MVSFWPWKEDMSSPASFEKALSKLSTQITSATLTLETTRSRSRSLKGLWTLYTTIAFLVYTMILALVIGPQGWSQQHYAALGGAPFVIYGVRKGIVLFFDWRISHQQSHLDRLQLQRDNKIAALKKATRFDTTQELLQRYGDTPDKASSKSPQPQQGTKRKISTPPQQGRTGIAPPPTANIPGRAPASSTTRTPQRSQIDSSPPGTDGAFSPLSASAMMGPSSNIITEEPGFAPNAFSNVPPTQSRAAYDHQPKWYDRLVDVLLGEDESVAKNRLALICANCRLVNGQAPPGVKTLEDLGAWRCGSCGAWNGRDNENFRRVKERKEGGTGTKRDQREEWERTSRHEEAGGSPNMIEILNARGSPPAVAQHDRFKDTIEVADSVADDDSMGQSDEDGEDSKISEEQKPRRSTRNASKQKAKGK